MHISSGRDAAHSQRMPKIYIVSLPRAIERRRFMELQLKKLGLAYQFVEAFDAKDLPVSDVESVNGSREYVAPLKPGEIACAISHSRACEALAADGSCDGGLIVEDDVILGRELPAVLSALQLRNDQLGVVLLSATAYRKIELTPEGEVGGGYQLVRPSSLENVFGTTAYFLSKAKAKALSQTLVPVRSIADDWKRYSDVGTLECIKLIFPFPVLHAEFLSVVNEKMEVTSLSLKSRFKNYFYRRRLFPFYQMFLFFRRFVAERRQKKNISLASGFNYAKTYKL